MALRGGADEPRAAKAAKWAAIDVQNQYQGSLDWFTFFGEDSSSEDSVAVIFHDRDSVCGGSEDDEVC